MLEGSLVMSDGLYWLTDDQMARLRPYLPCKSRGVPRVDDRRVISGIIRTSASVSRVFAASANGDIAARGPAVIL